MFNQFCFQLELIVLPFFTWTNSSKGHFISYFPTFVFWVAFKINEVSFEIALF